MDGYSDDIRRPLSPRIEVYAGVGRKQWPDDLEAQIVAESLEPGAIVTDITRRHGCRPQQVHDWRRRARSGQLVLPAYTVTFVPQRFEAKIDHVAQKGDTAKALRYALRHWDGLTLYLDDRRIEMDTNAVERAMRPIKLNAKNSLFASCDEGAESWALVASLIETCKLNTVSAEHWLADVLAELVNGWPAARLDELLPWSSTYTMHAHDPRLAA